MWHAIIVLQSAPRPHLRYNFKILPAHQTQNLEQTLYQSPNKNLTLWPKLTLQICTKLLSACFSSSKLWISKKYTLFHFLWKTTSFTHLTQFYIPSQNEPIWKTPFFIFSTLASGKTERLWTIFLGLDYSCKYTHNKMSNQETEDVLYWRLGILDCNATMGNEQLGILHHPQNRSFWQHRGINFWIIGHRSLWILNCSIEESTFDGNFWIATQRWEMKQLDIIASPSKS